MNDYNESMEIKDDSSMPQDASVVDVDRIPSAKQTLIGGDLMVVLALTALLGLVIGVIVLIELAN
ncbi:hypothetical protein KXR83_02150 [Williamsia muralis]|uniref:hypothetical protein n=1 Tax=Williamsia marianensis TaxID=85044 RepID=UPI003F15617E